ncbi:hypothetical protein ACQY0O_001975 [Thecaphora frezii]
MPGLPSQPNNIPLASSLPKVSFRRIPAEEALALAAPAGVLDQQNVEFGFNDGRPFERPEHYLRYVEPIESELKQQVEYDMDEQDQEWLDALNADRKREQLDPISNEVFEIIIDQLEKEWFDLMKQVPTKHPHGTGEDAEDGDDDGEDTKCAICDDGEGENSNAIVFCDGCNLAVHQDCYGIPYVPEGQWLCRKCTVSPDRAVSCILCPHEGGAFKQTTQGKWAHLLCAMWIPETGVSNPVYMEPIDSVEKIPKARWRLNCYLCRCKMGACIQCDSKLCYAAFHVTCARKAGLLIQTERRRVGHYHGDDSDDHSGGDVTQVLRARCHKHIPPKLRSQLKIPFDRAATVLVEEELDGHPRGSPFHTAAARDGSTDASTAHGSNPALPPPLIPVSRSTSVQAEQRDTLSKSDRAYKKSYQAGPPLVPAYVVNRVLDYIGRISLRKKPPLVEQVARFWSLKREARRGAPLLKRLHLEPWTASSQNKEQTDAQKAKKLAFLNTLRNDLEAVRMLAELVRKREREKLRQAKLLRDALVDATLFPYFDVLASTLAKIEALDRTHFFAAPVSRTEVPDYYDVIKEPMDWTTMREKLQQKAYRSVQEFKDDVLRVVNNAMIYNKADTPFHKAAARISKQLSAIFPDLDQLEGLHLAHFEATCKRLLAVAQSDAREPVELRLGDEVRDALLQLRLEPPIDHVKLLRDYEAMGPKELNEVRGPENRLAQFFSEVIESTAHEAPNGSVAQPAPVRNVVDDLARQFYRPRISASRVKRVMGRASAAAQGVATTPNTRSRRHSSEVSVEAAPAPTPGERRASKRLRGEAMGTPKPEVPPVTPRAKKRPVLHSRAMPRAATRAAREAAADTTAISPSVPPIPEDGEAEEVTQDPDAKQDPQPHVEAAEEKNKAATDAHSRSSRGAGAVTRSTRSTRAHPANEETASAADDGRNRASEVVAKATVDANGAESANGAAGAEAAEVDHAKRRRPKRGQIPGEPDEIETETVDDHDSFLRFNKGWILKDGAKRNRSARALSIDQPPAKRPRKVSAPSANTLQTVAEVTLSPRRARSRTQPTKPSILPSIQSSIQEEESTERTTSTLDATKEGLPSATTLRKRPNGSAASPIDAEAPVVEEVPDNSLLPATRLRSTWSRNVRTYGGAGASLRSGKATTASKEPFEGVEDQSSPLSLAGDDAAGSEEDSEAEDEDADVVVDSDNAEADTDADADVRAADDAEGKGDQARWSKKPKDAADEEVRQKRNAAERPKRIGERGARETAAGAANAAADATDGAQVDDGAGETDEEAEADDDSTGVPSRRAYRSRKSKVKVPPTSATLRSSPRKGNRSSADDGKDPLCVPHTLVWAKMEGFPFFPAEVVDEEDTDSIPAKVLEDRSRQLAQLDSLRRQTSTTPTSVSPHPPNAQGAEDTDSAAEGGKPTRLVLVQFYGGKVREYVWLPTSKLKLMLEDPEVDDECLQIKSKKYAKHRKRVREAYLLAKAQVDA